MPNSRLWTVSMWLLLTFLIGYSYAFIAATERDSNSTGECQSLVSLVTSKHRLPPSVSQPGNPAIFCDLGVHFPFLRSYDSLFIYGVLDSAEQDAILSDLRNHHTRTPTHRMLVRFISKENWRTWSDPATGRSGGSRGPETPLRTEWIE
jgi:hypothetical protein